MKWIRARLLPVILMALTASVIWTYISLKAIPAADKTADGVLEILPDYQIVSGRDLLAWPKGTVFNQGMAAYFYAAEPELRVTPVIRLSGAGQGLLSGTVKTTIILQAVNDKSEVYWSYQMAEVPSQNFSLSQGTLGQPEFTAAGITLYVPSAYELASGINNDILLKTGNIQALIVTQVSAEGNLGGVQINRSLTQTLPLTLMQESFTLPTTDASAAQIALATDNSISPGKGFAASVLTVPVPFAADIILALLLIILLLKSDIRGAKAAAAHRRFREWITEGHVDARDRLGVHILSLEGLVDLAIDLDKRVIYDPRINKYYVLTEDMVYTFDPDRTKLMLENKTQLGKLLIENGLLLPEQLELGLYYQKEIGSRLGESLITLGFIDETTLYSMLAAQQRIDYYELDPEDYNADTGWLDKLSLQKARVLMAVPIGERPDGKLVVASSEATREGIKKALQEIFDKDIVIAAARPSVINTLFERIAAIEKKRIEAPIIIEGNQSSHYELFTDKERELFIASYNRGNIQYGIFLKAAGLADDEVLEQVPEKETMLSWLTNKNIISGDTANLIKGLDRAVDNMGYKARRRRLQPGLMDLLLNAHYLTSETIEWFKTELSLQNITQEQLLIKACLASGETVKNAQRILQTLDHLLSQKADVIK